MSRSALAVALVAAIGLAVVAAGCGQRKSVLAPNLPPETSVYVQGPVSTVSHRVHLYWFGSDPDGDVVGYEMRFVPPDTAKWDTVWCALPGRCTDSVFTVFTGDSALIHTRFEIRSMDDKGEVDPTPATQTFALTNLAPQVTIPSPYGMGDSTYASVTVSWEVDDRDGGGPGLHYRIWLDGNEAGYDVTAERTFIVPSSRFTQNHAYTSGPRTLFIQGVDDGGRKGPPASMTWYVRLLAPHPRGNLLIVDQVPSLGVANATHDAFYLTAVTDSLPPARFSVLRPEFNRRIFRSARDFAQTLRQFRAVLWYRGQEASVDSLLVTYQDSLEAYLDTGGNLYLDGLYLVEGRNTLGALTEGFAERHLRTIGMYNNSPPPDSTAGWSNKSNSVFRSSIYGDVMRATFIVPTIELPPTDPRPETPGIRAFVVADTGSVAVWAMDSQLFPSNVGFEAPVGISTTQAGGGRLVFITMPIRLGAPAPAGRLLKRMLFGYFPSTGVSTPGLITP